MQIGMSTSSSISVDIGVVYGTENDGTIELRVTLFSTTFVHGSLAFFYKKSQFDDWMEDACIVSSSSKFQNGNELHGLPCSSSGYESRLFWNYKENGLTFGSGCIVKAMVIPSLNIACQVDEYSRMETVFNDDRIIDKGLFGTIIGFDFNGNLIKLESDNVSIIDPVTSKVLMSLTGLSNPVHAVGTSSGGLLVLESDGTITECDQDGTATVTFDASAMALGDEATLILNYDTNNLLISGGDIALVSEIAWGGIDHGTVLWNYSGSLSLPTGAVYGDGLETVLFCDSGNNRIIVIDRSYNPESVVTISSVTTDGNPLALQNPIRCAMINDTIYVCEANGRVESFGETASTHPAMARSGFGTASGSDALPQFAKMRFMPIVRSVK
jgi:hypothetical protein